jgi:putative effector of murein hydrolase LrgA (UPF0299 family)
MQALQGITVLLVLQSLGELVSRGLHLPLPGPVVGLLLLLVALRWQPVKQCVGAVADFLLSHLSLLFVPVGVGVMTHLPLLSQYGVRIGIVLVVSTWISLAVTAWVMRRLMHDEPGEELP